MNKNPFEDTFEDYVAFHNNIMKSLNNSSTKLTESENVTMTVDEIIKSENLTPIDKFLKDMNEKYGI